NPPDHRLDAVVRALLGETPSRALGAGPHRSTIARDARRLVNALSKRLHPDKSGPETVATLRSSIATSLRSTSLTPDYVSTVLSRLREVLFG
ncbi:MAG TPA: hypothetical protein VMX57_04465, partial [Planctomycetota bacterium]|nr:hypothetical protein [Planctomycetota bacterium]